MFAFAKANKMLGLLNRTIKCKDTSSLVCFYKSLVRPPLEFCLPAWSPHYAKDKVLIGKAQRRLARQKRRLIDYLDFCRCRRLEQLPFCCHYLRAPLALHEVIKRRHAMSFFLQCQVPESYIPIEASPKWPTSYFCRVGRKNLYSMTLWNSCWTYGFSHRHWS